MALSGHSDALIMGSVFGPKADTPMSMWNVR
jgi:hypothetical protein